MIKGVLFMVGGWGVEAPSLGLLAAMGPPAFPSDGVGFGVLYEIGILQKKCSKL